MNHTHFKLTTHELGLYYNFALYLPRVLEQVSRKSPVLVTLHHTVILISNISLKENKPDGVNLNSNDIDYYAQKEKFYGFWQTEVWACIS